MAVNIFQWSDAIPQADLGALLNRKIDLKARLGRLLRQARRPSQESTPTNFQANYIDLYSEQVTQDALEDIKKYFTTVSNQGFTVAGLPLGFPPFILLPQRVKPSNSAIAGIGEGLSGWYMEKAGWIPVRRPIGIPIDLVFRDSKGAYYALAQVKATQEPDVKAQMSESAVPFLQYTYNALPQLGAVICFVIGVIITPGGDYDLLSLKIEMP